MMSQNASEMEEMDSMVTQSSDPDISVYWQYSAQNNMFLYISPILIICGSIGNSLIILVMQNAAFHSTPSSIMLSTLAVSDTGILLTGLLRHWIKVLTNDELDVRCQSNLSCKFHFFFTYFLKQLSPWCLVLLTMERMISVFYPMRCHTLCSKRRMVTAVAMVTIVLACFNAHCFITIHLVDTSKIENKSPSCCLEKNEFKDFIFGAWYWIDSILTSFIPFLVILTGNILIISKIYSAKRKRDKISQTSDTNNSTRLTSTTTILIFVSICFLLLTLPSCIFFIGSGHGAFSKKNNHDVAKLMLAYASENMLFYLNNSINFFLYCLSGSKFRHVLWTMVSCQKGEFLPGRSTTRRTITKD